jgi:hypothetical protein
LRGKSGPANPSTTQAEPKSGRALTNEWTRASRAPTDRASPNQWKVKRGCGGEDKTDQARTRIRREERKRGSASGVHTEKPKNSGFSDPKCKPTRTNEDITQDAKIKIFHCHQQGSQPIHGGLRPPSLFLIGTKFGTLLT